MTPGVVNQVTGVAIAPQTPLWLCPLWTPSQCPINVFYPYHYDISTKSKLENSQIMGKLLVINLYLSAFLGHYLALQQATVSLTL